MLTVALSKLKEQKYLIQAVAFFVVFAILYGIIDSLNMSYSEMASTYGNGLVILNVFLNLLMAASASLLMTLGTINLKIKGREGKGESLGFLSIFFRDVDVWLHELRGFLFRRRGHRVFRGRPSPRGTALQIDFRGVGPRRIGVDDPGNQKWEMPDPKVKNRFGRTKIKHPFPRWGVFFYKPVFSPRTGEIEAVFLQFGKIRK